MKTYLSFLTAAAIGLAGASPVAAQQQSGTPNVQAADTQRVAPTLLPDAPPTLRIDMPEVRSYFEGSVTVDPAVDSTGNYQDFEVLVARQIGEELDTLGYAVTDRDGRFRMDVRAPRRAVFALIIKRLGEVLSTSAIAVSEGDSARLRVQFPLNGRTPRVTSYENAAWLAYLNTEAQYNQTLVDQLKEGQRDETEIARTVERSAALLWSLRGTYPGTIGANVASVKAITLLDGWNDSLVVAHTAELVPDTPGFVEAVRTAARAQIRLEGVEAGVALLRDAQERSREPGARAALQAGIVQTYLDHQFGEQAAEAARVLQQMQPKTQWDVWAQRAEYEALYLLPGMEAPSFQVVTRDDSLFVLEQARGSWVVLEFWEPRTQVYQNQVPGLLEVKERAGDRLTWVSFVMESDIDYIDAFFEGRNLPGIVYVQTPQMYRSSVARLFNVNSLPTRYLIDDAGRIRAKYLGESLLGLLEDVESELELAPAP